MTHGALQPTDYVTLIRRVIEECQAAPLDYHTSVTALIGSMRQNFPALRQDTNPVVTHFPQWSADDLAFIIQEYSGFSNAAIHMFLEARIRNHWPAVTQEIIRNMDEEMGVLTRNVPHLELMRYGYRAELGIETEELTYSVQTQDFIKRMTGLFCTSDNAFLCGCLLAFEGTAVDEFRIVEKMLRQHQKLLDREITADSLTGTYIAGHVTPGIPDPAFDPEMDHYRGMMEAIGKYIDKSNMERAMRGFFAVCLELNHWWEQIATLTLLRPLRAQLRNGEELKPTNLHKLYEQRAAAGADGELLA